MTKKKENSTDIEENNDAPVSQNPTIPDLSQNKAIMANVEVDNDTGQLFLKWDDMLVGLPEGIIVVDRSKLEHVIGQNKAFRKFKVEFEADLEYIVQTVAGFIGADGIDNPIQLVSKIGKMVMNPKKLEKQGIDLDRLHGIISKYVPSVEKGDNE